MQLLASGLGEYYGLTGPIFRCSWVTCLLKGLEAALSGAEAAIQAVVARFGVKMPMSPKRAKSGAPMETGVLNPLYVRIIA